MSAPLKLYEKWSSSTSWRVRCALNFKSISYESKPVENFTWTGENAEFVKSVNPTGRIPVLVHGDRIITESLTIVEYLDENLPGPKLLTSGSLARAQSRAIALHIDCGIQPIQNVRVTRKVEELAGSGRHQEWANYWMRLGVEELEGMVRKTAGAYCVGDEITIADVCLPSIVYRARAWGASIYDFPTLTRIDATLQQIPAFAAAHPDLQIDAPKEH